MDSQPVGARPRTELEMDERVARAVTHPLRIRILGVLWEREASPREIAEILDEPLGKLAYHVRTLAELGCIRLVRTEPRRGAVEHYYRAVVRPVMGDAGWSELSPPARRSLTTAVLADVGREVSAAQLEGGFQADGVHLSRTRLRLDDAGRRRVNELLRELVSDGLAVEAEADRSAATESELVLMLFEAPAQPDA